MNKQELVSEINNCTADNSGIEIFLGLKTGDLRKANFLADTQQEIKDLFINQLNSKIVESDNAVIDFSSADERGNVIYQYDLEETPDMQMFNSALDAEAAIPLFSFDDDTISNLAYFLIVIGTVDHRLVIYKQIAPINIYKRNSGFFVRRADNAFSKIDEDFLRIIPGIDLLKINDELFILNLGVVEKSFNMYDVIVKSANRQIEVISQYDLVENIECLTDELSDVSFARKLSRIAEHSPVLGHVSNQNIIAFTHNHPALRNVFKYSGDNTQIKLSSKKAKRIFLKLLNDDYLNSDLTNIYYDSMAKDTVENEIEEN